MESGDDMRSIVALFRAFAKGKLENAACSNRRAGASHWPTPSTFVHNVAGLCVTQERRRMWRALQQEQTRRWLSGDRMTIEAVLQAHPELNANPQAVAQLILSEVALRSAIGEQPNLADYVARFPQCAAWLGQAGAAATNSRDTDSHPVHGDETYVAAPAELPSVVMSPQQQPPPSAADSAAAVSSPAPSPNLTPVPPPPPRLADLYNDLPADEGTMAVAIPAASPSVQVSNEQTPPPSSPPPQSYETVQSQGDIKAVTAIIERLSAPSLKIPGYELLGELGRGGMGVVYRARQLSADRIVALKVIRNDVLETLPDDTRSSTIERFRQEAQAAAKIEHDHLVSVYEVGESDGLKYYAMRFVEGKSLYELLRDGPLANRRAAAYLEPVCRAIHAIHLHGVLHRDIKPHNIMIDRRGDRPLVTDFGLAKFVGGQDELTHAGTVMGTPSYMSPEQATDSAKVTALADVYSLGATLYHCLTGRAPFQAAHVADTLRQILRDDPILPRKLNPAIDRDLETICVKSLLKEPEKRYASAEALADDLARYLRGEPILARPVGPLARTWRWCRRNQLVASLIATAAVLAVIAIGAVGWSYYQNVQALKETNASLRKALAVVDEFCTTVAEEDLKNLPGFQPLRRDLLERAQRYYMSFVKDSQRGNDPLLQDGLGRAYFRMGMIQDELGSRAEALESLETARATQIQQLALDPQDESRRQALGDTLNFLGTRLLKMKRYEDSSGALAQAQDIRSRLADENPADAEMQRGVANTLMNRGLIGWAIGAEQHDRAELATAAKFIVEAQNRRQSFLPRAGDKRRAVQRDLARGYYSLAQVRFLNWKLLQEVETPKPEDAAELAKLASAFESDVAQARELFQQLQDELPELLDRYQFVLCLLLQGDARFEKGSYDTALASFEAARSHIADLARENPTVTSYQRELAEVHLRIADAYLELKQRPEARAEFQRGLDSLAKLLASPSVEPAVQELAKEFEAALEELGPE